MRPVLLSAPVVALIGLVALAALALALSTALTIHPVSLLYVVFLFFLVFAVVFGSIEYAGIGEDRAALLAMLAAVLAVTVAARAFWDRAMGPVEHLERDCVTDAGTVRYDVDDRQILGTHACACSTDDDCHPDEVCQRVVVVAEDRETPRRLVVRKRTVAHYTKAPDDAPDEAVFEQSAVCLPRGWVDEPGAAAP